MVMKNMRHALFGTFEFDSFFEQILINVFNI